MLILNRRDVLKWLTLGVIGAVSGKTIVSADESFSIATQQEELRIRWKLDRPHVKTVQELLHSSSKVAPDPTSTKDTKGLPLIYILASVVAIRYLADALLAVYRDIAYGGLVVTVRNEETVIETDRRIPGRTIVVQTGGKVQIFQSSDVTDPTELVTALVHAKKPR